MSKPLAILVDVDGTLALRRQGPGERGPHDWERVGEDLPNRPVIRAVQMIAAAGVHEVIVMSGRQERSRSRTEMWLDANLGVGLWDQLLMRPTGDSKTKDHDVKRGLYLEHVDPNYVVEMVFDDRETVVEMWRGLGLCVFALPDCTKTPA